MQKNTDEMSDSTFQAETMSRISLWYTYTYTDTYDWLENGEAYMNVLYETMGVEERVKCIEVKENQKKI